VQLCGVCAVPPRITQGPVSRNEVEGNSVTLQCHVVAAPYPDTVVSWSRDGRQIDVSSSQQLYVLCDAALHSVAANLRAFLDY